jgi:outer membrane receptor protein involved in Fe transport
MTLIEKIFLASFTAFAASQPVSADDISGSDQFDEVVVTSQRKEEPQQTHAGNIAVLGSSTIANVAHKHIHELMSRVPGVWVSRGSGQEHLTAIRSPVLTGAGSCGAYLLLEDGIPVRPAGFCNVNQMFELLTEQAARIEVIRGPANALYGSNALHGVVNAIMPHPGESFSPLLAMELGANEFYRVRADLPFDDDANYLASLVFADDGGFRDDSGYRQAKAHLKGAWTALGGDLVVGFSATDLDQETAGFILGEDAYKDESIRTSNANPEAFRDASSQRLYGLWSRELDGKRIDIRPYLRHSEMQFLQHFLPGQPLEENGQKSIGFLSSLSFEAASSDVIVGIDVEFSDSYLLENQDGPTQGSAFLMATRPEGKHYDYDVESFVVSPFVQSSWQINDKLRLHAGVRFEYLQHDYTNNMLSGNTRDDGTVCGFGGCLYTRPESRSDDYSNTAPKFAADYALNETTTLYANLARGFRAPQATELYRLQNGQLVSDLNSEQVDSLELGVRKSYERVSIDAAIYSMKKKNSVLRDSEGFNVSNGRSRHSGMELDVDWQWHDDWQLAANLSFGNHEYDFDLVAARGETFVSGREIDTAPRWLGSAELTYDAGKNFYANLQWTMIGEYFLNAENTASYPGHELLNLHLAYEFSDVLALHGRLNNIADDFVADRADFAFGNYRYFPGRGREFFAEIRYTPR